MVIAPISELLSRVLVQINETIHAARDVLIENEGFAQLSHYLETIEPVLAQLEAKGITETPTIRGPLEALGRQLQNAKNVIDTCRSKSRFYLLINCRSYTKKMQRITHEIGRILSLVPLTKLDLSLDLRENIKHLFQEMQHAEFKEAVAAEEIASRIESGIRDRRYSYNYANDLLAQIAKAVGADLDSLSLKKELEELKKEREAAEEQKNKVEALQLEQIANLLSWADAAFNAKEREKQYQDMRLSLGSHPFPALQSFLCPITKDIMDDPVDVGSGHTFERRAIEKWFAEGHNVCPVSCVELDNLNLRPNMLLKRSIDEWKERTIVIRLTTMASKLASDDEEVVAAALMELHRLCEEKTKLRHWIAAEGLIPVLVNLLKLSKSNIRKKTLATLTILVSDSLDIKGRACEEGVITLAVRSLAREVAESRHAVALLLEFSKEQKFRKQISEVQGCIVLLVMMTNIGILQVVEDAQMVLENLSKEKDQNIVLMAGANYFKPLVQCLNEGSDAIQIRMASAVSQMELTDQSRGVLVQLGILPGLVKMVSKGRLEIKSAALAALQNLSKFSENKDPMVEAGIVQPILDLLFSPRSVLMTLKEQAAVILANLAVTTTSSDSATDLLGKIPESEENIYQLLSLLNLIGPSIQSQILRALNGISSPPFAKDVRMTMREAGSIELLVGLCLVNANAKVRLYALKLLQSLTQDGGGDMLARELGQKSLESFAKLLDTSSVEDEKIAVMGILNNIPIDNTQVTVLMMEAELLPLILSFFQRSMNNLLTSRKLLENATGVLVRFTLPSDLLLQQYITENGVFPILLHLLASGTPLMKCRAAISLGQLSESTVKLTSPVKRLTWWFRCFASSREDCCKVHGGICSAQKSFCLVEAGAIPVLIQTLEEKAEGADEASLGALATLLYDEFWENGADAIAAAKGVGPVIRLLTIGSSRVQETAVWMLERIFRKERYKLKYGNTAQMPLISLTQDGTNKTRHYAAKILAHLNILHDQSSYF